MRTWRNPVALMCVAALWSVAAACRGTSSSVPESRADAGAPGPAVELRIGDSAPLFTLPGSDTKQYSLVSYRGRQAVVLAWFTKAFSLA